MNMPKSTVWKPDRHYGEKDEDYAARAMRVSILAWFATRLLATGIFCDGLAILFYAEDPVLGILIYVCASCIFAAFVIAWVASA